MERTWYRCHPPASLLRDPCTGLAGGGSQFGDETRGRNGGQFGDVTNRKPMEGTHHHASRLSVRAKARTERFATNELVQLKYYLLILIGRFFTGPSSRTFHIPRRTAPSAPSATLDFQVSRRSTEATLVPHSTTSIHNLGVGSGACYTCLAEG